MEVKGGPTPIYEFPRQACDRIDLPDEPPRAFRDASGMIHLFATHYVNRQLIGPSLSALRHICAPSFVGKHDPRPEAYDDYGWLSGFYTADGVLVYGIIHNEFHGNERPAICGSGVFLRCWENSVTAAISRNGGVTFSRVPDDRGVISRLPRRYAGDQPTQFGYFNPTNIIRFKGYFYFFMSMIDPSQGRSGVCAVRTANIADPSSWRGWDGGQFTIQFVNPYEPFIGSLEQHTCHELSPDRLMFSLGSVSFFKPAGVFIMVMRRQRWETVKDGTAPGVYFSTSPDLIDWSRPDRVILDTEASTKPDVVQFYPAMLDPDDRDHNFQDVSAQPLLLTTEFETQHENERRRLVTRWLQIRSR
jgi:hypothetical protein